MAYLNFAEPAGALAAASPWHDPVRPEVSLSGLEWSVVALARRDTLASLREPGPIAKAMAVLFGGGTDSRLADSRLETLRRVAVHAWYHGFAVPEAEVESFYGAGYSPDHLELILTSISRDRSERLWRA